jgi:hypothetical protein
MTVTEASFRAALGRCGIVDAEVRDAICDTQGIVNMLALSQLTSKEIKEMSQTIAKTRRAADEDQLIISALSLKKLQAMREWVIWRNRRNIELDHDEFDADNLLWSITRMNYEQRLKDADAPDSKEPEKLKNLTGWHIFWKQFDAYCQQVRGTMYIPIAYVYRAHEEATDEMDLREDYPNSDVQLMDLVALLGEDWEIDNALL